MEGIAFREDVEVLLDTPGFSVIKSPLEGELLATIRVDENLDPLPGSDPSDFGYVALAINYASDSLAIISVAPLESLIKSIDGIEVEVERG